MAAADYFAITELPYTAQITLAAATYKGVIPPQGANHVVISATTSVAFYVGGKNTADDGTPTADYSYVPAGSAIDFALKGRTQARLEDEVAFTVATAAGTETLTFLFDAEGG